MNFEMSRKFCCLLVKVLKHLTKNLFSNMKLLLEHREEDMKRFFQARINYDHFLPIFPRCMGGT